MKGKIIRKLKDYDDKTVWVEFESMETASCATGDAYGLSGTESQLYASGIYRVEGHFLISQKDTNLRFHEFTPHIVTIYEWQE